jgi:DNA polymerase I-like protein with 3'-5' exonuclease and polymerase domains
MSAAGLAQRLDVGKDVAQGYMAAFAAAYPKVEAFRELTRHAFAITGESWTLPARSPSARRTGDLGKEHLRFWQEGTGF